MDTLWTFEGPQGTGKSLALHALGEDFHAEITASIGIAESTGSTDAERLVERADKAMYRAKSRGGDRTVLSD